MTRNTAREIAVHLAYELSFSDLPDAFGFQRGRRCDGGHHILGDLDGAGLLLLGDILFIFSHRISAPCKEFILSIL